MISSTSARVSPDKQKLLLVDSDPRSCRVLEVSLRKAGFAVTTAANGADALDKALSERPELIISDTAMAVMDGFELRRRLRQNGELAEVPFIFLTSHRSVEDKIKGLELGVEDYLTKPIYIREILTRVRIALQKTARIPQGSDSQRRIPTEGRTKFAGQLADMGVVDLIQTLEISRKSGVINVSGPGGRRATLFFRNGSIIDAELGRLTGEDAIYRLLTWSEGGFEVDFKSIRRKDAVKQSAQALLMEGMRRLDEWTRLQEALPGLETVLEVDAEELGRRLGEVPDEANQVLKLFDGRRTLLEVIEDGKAPDLEAISTIAKLHADGFLCAPSQNGGPDLPDARAADGWFLGEKSGVFGITRVAQPSVRAIGTHAPVNRESIKRPTLRGFQVVVEPERSQKFGKSTLRGINTAAPKTPAGSGAVNVLAPASSSRAAGASSMDDEAPSFPEFTPSAVDAAFPEMGPPSSRAVPTPSPEAAAVGSAPVPMALALDIEVPARKVENGNGNGHGRAAVAEVAAARPISVPPIDVEPDSVIAEMPLPPMSRKPKLGDLAAEATGTAPTATATAATATAVPVHVPTRATTEPMGTRKSRAHILVDEAIALAEPMIEASGSIDALAPTAAMTAQPDPAAPKVESTDAATNSSDKAAAFLAAETARAEALEAAAAVARTMSTKQASSAKVNGAPKRAASQLPAVPPPVGTRVTGSTGRVSGSVRAMVAGGTAVDPGRNRRGMIAAGALAGVAVVVIGLVVRDAVRSQAAIARTNTPVVTAKNDELGLLPPDAMERGTTPTPTPPPPPAPTRTPVTPSRVEPRVTPMPIVTPAPAPVETAPPKPAVVEAPKPTPVIPTPGVSAPKPPAPALTATPHSTPGPTATALTAPTPKPATAKPASGGAVAEGLSYGAYYEQARAAARQGRNEDALALLDRALGVQPNGEDALLLKAKILRDKKRSSDALTLVNQYLKGRPYSVDGWRQKGLVHFDLGEVDKAKIALGKALTLAPPGSADAEAIRALLDSM